MLRFIVFRAKLARLEREKDKIIRAYAKDQAEARERGAKQDELESISSSQMHEAGTVNDEISSLHTAYLVKRANRLHLPIPEKWEQSKHYGYFYLSREGVNELKKAIRGEVSEGHQMFLRWLPVVGALTGLVGAATGFLAVWSKLPK